MKFKRKQVLVLVIIVLFLIFNVIPSVLGTFININYHEVKENEIDYLKQEENYQIYNKYRRFVYEDINIINKTEPFNKKENLDNSSQMNENDIIISELQIEDIQFYGQGNESIYIVKISNSEDIIMDQFSFEITNKIIGKKESSGAFITRCSLFDENIGGGLYPIMAIRSFESYSPPGLLRYLHYDFGKMINYTYENRTVSEYDNETFFSRHLYYPFCPVKIPPGTWYFVFSSIIYDLDQTDFSTDWTVWMNFSGNFSNQNISTGEGGKIYKRWYGEFDANIIVSKKDFLELMFNGNANFHIENTFFYRYESYPRFRGFWHVKWITPDGTKKFNMIMLRKRWIYDEDDWEGCIWGMGGSGDYELRTSYVDYGRNIFGAGPTNFPTFVGLDVKLP